MEVEKIKNVLHSEEYDFLKTDSKLNKNVILLTMGGSIAYGTDHPGSDIDVRGIAMLSEDDIYMQNDWLVYRNENSDTTIYSLQHMLKLLSECNPNTIEILGCVPEHNLYKNEIGQSLIDHRHMFLSTMAIDSFCGYASKQFQRMENQMLNRDDPDRAQINIERTIKRSYQALRDRFQRIPQSVFNLYLDKAVNEVPNLSQEVFIDLNLKHLPLKDLNDFFQFMRTIERDYYKTSQRNKKAMAHNKINKHCEHLVRLYMTGIDILEKEEIITMRTGEDHDVLLSILNKEFMDDNDLPNKEFYDLLKKYEAKFDEAIKNTNLPSHPDYEAIKEWTRWAHRTAFLRKD